MTNKKTASLIAYAIGMDAADRGMSRAPACSKTIMQMVSNNPDKAMGASIHILAGFSAGYQAHCNAAATAILSA